MMALMITLNQNGMIEQTFLGPDRLQLLLQWCLYIVVLCTFHLLEFFVTAVYNPYVTSSDSFLINHSTAYTAAALVCSSCCCAREATYIVYAASHSDCLTLSIHAI